MRNPLKRPGGSVPSPPASGRPLELVVSEQSRLPPATAAPERVPVSASAAPVPAMAPDQAVLVERRKRHAELMERRALRRADAAEAAVRYARARVERLEVEL